MFYPFKNCKKFYGYIASLSEPELVDLFMFGNSTLTSEENANLLKTLIHKDFLVPYYRLSIVFDYPT